MRGIFTLGAVLLLLAGVGAAAAIVADGGDDCDRDCQHQRFVRQCHADPTWHDRCGAVTDRVTDRDVSHERLRAHCADHPDDARCERLRHADSDRASDQERLRRYCAEHPDDRRCA